MKSSYELAMERLGRKSPQDSKPVSDAQKKQLGEVDRVYKAKIAEKELFLTPQIQKAKFEGDATAHESLQKQLHEETKSLREQLEREKEKIRSQSRP